MAAILANPRYTGRQVRNRQPSQAVLAGPASTGLGPQALAILLAAPAGTPARGSRSRAKLTGPSDTAALIDQLRADGTVLTYDPDGRTLHAGGHDAPPVVIGKDATTGTHSRQDRKRRTA